MKDNPMHTRHLPVLLIAATLGLLLAAPSITRAGDLPATIVVRLPADAKLTIDGNPTRATSALRRFITPPLEQGRPFHYTVKAEFSRGGKTVTVRKRIAVRAGRDTVVSLGPPATYSYGASPAAPSRATSGSRSVIYYPSPGPIYFNFGRYSDAFQWAPDR
jgi:uncharacterized protein (TIGR03000 family)